jgi:hypothetical protein
MSIDPFHSSFPEQYIKDAGLDTNPDYPVSRARGITATQMEIHNDEDDKDFVDLNDDAVIEEMGMDTEVEADTTEGFRTKEQRDQGENRRIRLSKTFEWTFSFHSSQNPVAAVAFEAGKCGQQETRWNAAAGAEEFKFFRRFEQYLQEEAEPEQ